MWAFLEPEMKPSNKQKHDDYTSTDFPQEIDQELGVNKTSEGRREEKVGCVCAGLGREIRVGKVEDWGADILIASGAGKVSFQIVKDRAEWEPRGRGEKRRVLSVYFFFVPFCRKTLNTGSVTRTTAPPRGRSQT